MTVRKFRSVEDMKNTGDVDPASPELPRVLREVWMFAARLSPASPRRGVTRFRTLEEMNAHREGWSRIAED